MKIYVDGELITEGSDPEKVWWDLVDKHFSMEVFGFQYKAIDDNGNPVEFPSWVIEDLMK